MKRTALRRQSADRRVEQAVRRGIAAELGCQPCTIRAWRVCSGWAEAFHELVGAAQGGSRVDRLNLAPCCHRCNSFIEDRPAEAYLHGWKVRREHAVEGNRGLVPADPSPYAVATLQGGWDG